MTTKPNHPLETFFDIEAGTTPSPHDKQLHQSNDQQLVPLSAVPDALYDDRDEQIESQFQEIYDAAMDAYGVQLDESELVEGRYKARAAEIAVQMLNTALNAANSKGTLKSNKDKLKVAERKVNRNTGGTVNNNMVVGTTTEILKMMRDAKKAEDDAAVVSTQD